MLFLAVLAMAPGQLDPEIEALMRRRDAARQQAAQTQYEARQDADALATVIPPAMAQRLSLCLAKADSQPADGLAEAVRWAGQGGGPYAAQCKGYALGKAGRWTEAAGAFEAGGVLPGLELRARARLWSQAGNAALAGGDATRAARDFDQALSAPLPRTLSTGEIHLDRARARVALRDLKGARDDLNLAVQLAPADPMAWLLSATLARRMNDLPLARIQIAQAARLARDDPSVAIEEGVIDALSGDRDEAARAAFQRAVAAAAPGSDAAKRAQAYLAELGPAPVKPKAK